MTTKETKNCEVEVTEIQAIKRNGKLGKPTASIENGKIKNISLNASYGQSRIGLDALAGRMIRGFNENDTSKFKVTKTSPSIK